MSRHLADKVTDRQRLDAVYSLTSFVVGVGADIRNQDPPIEYVAAAGEASGAAKDAMQAMRDVAPSWSQLDPADFPFIRSIAHEFETHDNHAQFRAGVDLILAGIALQAGLSS